MKYLVTGGAGFIGTNLVNKLVEQGNQVTVLDDFSTGLRSNVNKECKVMIGSILDADILRREMANADCVFHLAAKVSVAESIANPGVFVATNFEGTRNVIDAAKQYGPKVIFASSSAVYGSRNGLPISESADTYPDSAYGRTKLDAEKFALEANSTGQVDITTFRFFNVFGPYQRLDLPNAAIIPAAIRAATEDGALAIFGDGEQTRDFLHVDHVVKVLVAATEPGRAGFGPFNVGSGKPVSLNMLIANLKEQFPALSVIYKDAREGEIRHSVADISSLRAHFGILSEPDFGRDLATTIKWYSQRNRPSL